MESHKISVSKLSGHAFYEQIRSVSFVGLAVALVTILFLLYSALFLIDYQIGNNLTRHLNVGRWTWIRDIVERIVPHQLTSSELGGTPGTHTALLYVCVSVGLVVFWLLAMRLLQPHSSLVALGWVLIVAMMFSVPMIALTAQTSGDIFLYIFYGHTIAHYDQNPFVYAPGHFRPDPLLRWAVWRYTRSAYGPLWLMLSAPMSALAGNTLITNLVLYKLLLLGLHLITTITVWLWFQQIQPRLAIWGAVFYGWNPVVLYEGIGNGHNDLAMATFVALSLLAVSRRRWLMGIFFMCAAAMIKLTALLFLPPLMLIWLLRLSGLRSRLLALATGGAVGLGTLLLLYAPLWAGSRYLTNVLDNPAVTSYMNSMWRIVVSQFHPTNRVATQAIEAQLEPVRYAILAIAYLVILYLFVYRKQKLSHACLWIWVAYCLTSTWIWPWYFVLPILLAAMCGPSRSGMLAVGLTLGALLYWLLGSIPPLSHTEMVRIRPVLFIGPAIIMILLPFLGYWLARFTVRNQSTLREGVESEPP